MATAAGIDGPVSVGILPRDGCCPPSLCNISLCGLACDFVHQLPRGPLWDKPKHLAMSYYQSAGCVIGGCAATICNSLVSHAIYTAERLWSALMDGLWPAIRESDPFTAFDTVDDWLARLGWRNCFESACRDPKLGIKTPLEVMGLCGCAIYEPPTFPAELVLAVKIATLQSLARLNLGISPNLAAINFVIAPLGAVLTAQSLSITDISAPGDCVTVPIGCANQPAVLPLQDPISPCCPRQDHPVWQICYTAQTLPKPIRMGCDLPDANVPNAQTIPAYYDTTANDPAGLPARIWPGLLAAECIVRSIIGSRPFELVRCYP